MLPTRISSTPPEGQETSQHHFGLPRERSLANIGPRQVRPCSSYACYKPATHGLLNPVRTVQQPETDQPGWGAAVHRALVLLFYCRLLLNR